MSKIGKKIIELPASVTIKYEKGGEFDGLKVTVTGPKGELTQSLRPGITLTQEGNIVTLVRDSEAKQTKAYHGLYRSLIANMVDGVVNGYSKKLEVVGVGYRGAQKGTNIELSLGFSHKVIYKTPADVEVKMVDENNILITGADKQRVGQTAAEIRQLRKPEPYKGKGIRYLGEVVRRKAGKQAAK
jgi:large subunit ribosomal protein L6